MTAHTLRTLQDQITTLICEKNRDVAGMQQQEASLFDYIHEASAHAAGARVAQALAHAAEATKAVLPAEIVQSLHVRWRTVASLRLYLVNHDQFQQHQNPDVTCHCHRFPDAYERAMLDDPTDEDSTTTVHVCTCDLDMIRHLKHAPEQHHTAEQLLRKLSLGPSGRLDPSVSEGVYEKFLSKAPEMHMKRQKRVLGLPTNHGPDLLVDLATTHLAKSTLPSLPELASKERNLAVQAQKTWFIMDGDKDSSALAITCRDLLAKNMRRELNRPHHTVQSLLDSPCTRNLLKTITAKVNELVSTRTFHTLSHKAAARKKATQKETLGIEGGTEKPPPEFGCFRASLKLTLKQGLPPGGQVPLPERHELEAHHPPLRTSHSN